MQKTINNQKGNIYKNFLELIAVGIITGIVVGTIVTFFNILVHEGEHISRDIYGYIRANLWFLPLLLLTLALTPSSAVPAGHRLLLTSTAASAA